ncbi:MAG TPA: tetratricopeptide repeat protein [Polyangiaceae bacterium]
MRAEWMESEARLLGDPQARSRALVVASEIWAIAGNLERARRAAQDASSAGRAVMAGRQLRWLAGAGGDWKTVASALELELRGSSTPEARAHAAYLDAEVQRLCLADDAAATKAIDLVLAADPNDPRAHLAKLVQALGTTAAAPALELPDAPELEELRNAIGDVARLRAGSGVAGGQGPLAAFAIARRAIARGDRAAAATALGEVGMVEGLAGAASWLSAALLCHDAGTRAEAAARLRALSDGPDAAPARRALAARALELGDPALLGAALEFSAEAFSAADRLVLRALTDRNPADIDMMAEDVADEEHAALRAGILAASARPTAEAGTDASRAAAALGRALARSQGAGNELDALEPAARAHAAVEPGAVSRLLAIELAAAAGRGGEIAEALGNWGKGAADAPSARDRAVARALVLELSGDDDAARAGYEEASLADGSFEAALRARIAVMMPDAASEALATLADASADPAHAALLLIEAALRTGPHDPTLVDERLKRAATLDPTLSLTFCIAEQHARSSGDVERLVEWLRARREVTTDDVERALDLVREALLVADTAPDRSAELLDGAIQSHPGDVGLRELHERMSPAGDGDARGVWREAAAEHATETTRQLLLMQAAFEYERGGNREAAARMARMAAATGGALAALTAQRTAAGTPEATRVSEDLLERARAATEPGPQRELYEQLSDLDRERGDAASVVLWQSAILEGSPEWLPALRHLEQAYASAGRDEELEPTASALAKVLPDAEGIAHARIAARLRLKAGAWSARRELAELAAGRDPKSLWALRSLAAHARAADEPEKALDAYRRLFDLVTHPLDKATLALRAAEAAARLGRFEEAKTLLESCIERVPDHLVGLTTLSEVLEALRDFPGAARALEVAAESSQVDPHRVGAWHQAAVMWLDRVGDVERGRAALEQALALDPSHEDATVRLQNLLIEAGDRASLASLLERRSELATDPEERVALEVQRGKLLAGVGESAAAKSALTAALDANPDHVGALEALSDLSLAEGDWTGAEQALIRLVRHTPDPARQIQIYKKLGDLYDTNLPNPERADLAYQEVLKRAPDDAQTVERLVQVAGKLGQRERAVELQSGLLERATTREEKRDRTLALASVLEQIAGDKKRAEALFEKAKKEWPQDVAVLRALVEYQRRGGEQRVAQMLLDRAATDARRALSTGRFEPNQFEVLGTVADLRGFADAALVADATLAALAGQPFPVHGAGSAVAKPELDELLAPELVTPALRTLLAKSGEVLDGAYALDPRTLRAHPLAADATDLATQVKDLAEAFGIQGLEVLVSPALGPTCLAARSFPAQIVYGSALLERGDDASRYFLLVRALKLIQARAATLARTVPTDLGPVVAGYLSTLADYTPEGIDPKRLGEAQKRIKAALPRPYQGEVPMLALEVVGTLGGRASQLATALNQWATRTAFLAVGSPLTAIRALALASGATLPAEGPERLRFIARHAEARDIAVFSVSEQYAEVRKRLGVEG